MFRFQAEKRYKFHFEDITNLFSDFLGPRKAGKVFVQTGLLGQICYIDFENDVVMVRFGADPVDAVPTDFNFFIDYLKENGDGKKEKKKVKKVPKKKAKYPDCNAENWNMLGDGHCDPDYNVTECGFDDGDCE